ncbi:phosphotyrosine protein phosphatase [Campylobacter sp. MIT 99-7217]|uniref:low molecular weight protein-tyrosine-phosphatase n=1 Tax=Campylobacter sp. MIT 99-7217 TaxID=535091 RepID=UPI00115A4227|nr:low molecular weight protein-tyrosine-phosphatase [Campylobacter sp. MIT 99-7217]TQR31911.1 phosphotyrosine protein phosphatase [Campylobacter sp. MIT 99-7217]
MLKICFVCLGNICRSPMAEFVMKDLVKNAGLESEICVFSAGTSGEHNGEDMHFKTKAKLKQMGINAQGFTSKKLSLKLCEESDFLIVMDESNFKNASQICKNKEKILRLCDFAKDLGYKEVPDPWYSGDFDETYRIISKACENLLIYLKK